METILKGTTEECFRHFCDAEFNGDKRGALAAFMGRPGDDSSVRRWVRTRQIPVGIDLVKLRFFLEALGYEVEELAVLSDIVRDFARIVAYGLYDIEAANEEFGYKNIQSLYVVLHSKSGASVQVEDKMYKITQAFSPALSSKQQSLNLPRFVPVEEHPAPSTADDYARQQFNERAVEKVLAGAGRSPMGPQPVFQDEAPSAVDRNIVPPAALDLDLGGDDDETAPPGFPMSELHRPNFVLPSESVEDDEPLPDEISERLVMAIALQIKALQPSLKLLTLGQLGGVAAKQLALLVGDDELSGLLAALERLRTE